MVIPGGLTLRVKDRKNVTRRIGNTILNSREMANIQFRSTEELREALILERRGDILIFGEIPQEVMDLVTLDGEIASPVAPAKQVVYQEELDALLGSVGGGSSTQIEKLAVDPENPKIGRIWMIDPPPADGKVIRFMTSAGIHELTAINPANLPKDGTTMDQSVLLTIGGRVSSTIDPTQPERWFRIDGLTTGANYVAETHGAFDTEMTVFDGAGNIVGEGLDAGEVYNAKFIMPATTETVYLRVYPYGTSLTSEWVFDLTFGVVV